MNIAPSHQADFLTLLLSEAGARVIGQNGAPMRSNSYAMLSIAPSYSGDADQLVHIFAKSMHDYKGWNPEKVQLQPVAPRQNDIHLYA